MGEGQDRPAWNWTFCDTAQVPLRCDGATILGLRLNVGDEGKIVPFHLKTSVRQAYSPFGDGSATIDQFGGWQWPGLGSA